MLYTTPRIVLLLIKFTVDLKNLLKIKVTVENSNKFYFKVSISKNTKCSNLILTTYYHELRQHSVKSAPIPSKLLEQPIEFC